jgi:hypothetical protein
LRWGEKTVKQEYQRNNVDMPLQWYSVSRIIAAVLQYFPPFGRVRYLWRWMYVTVSCKNKKTWHFCHLTTLTNVSAYSARYCYVGAFSQWRIRCWAIRSWHSKKEKFDFSLFRFSEKFQINRCIRGLAAMSSHRFQKNETPRPPNLASLNGGLVVKSNLSINILINYAHIIKRQRELKTKSILTFIGNFQLFIITGSVWGCNASLKNNFLDAQFTVA